MDGLTLHVEPLDPTTGNLVTKQGVDVLTQYNGFNAQDTTLVKWGVYGKMLAPAATQANPVQHTPVPPNHICNGYATAWFSARDSIGRITYSESITVTIELNVLQGLDSPTIIAVDPADPTQGMQIEVYDDPEYDLVLMPGDELVVMYNLYTKDDVHLGDFKKTVSLPSTVDGSYTTVPITPVPQHQQYMVVQYTLTRTQFGEDNGNGMTSPPSEQQFRSVIIKKFAQQLWPDGSDSLPALVFTDAVNGVLYLDAVQGDVKVAIPSTPLIENSTVTFKGNGVDMFGQPVAAATWAPAPVVVPATPYSGMTVPRDIVRAVGNDGTFAATYSEKIYSSGSTGVVVKLQHLDPPAEAAGTLWGWGDPQYGTLG